MHVCMCTCKCMFVCVCMYIIILLATVLFGLYDLAFVLSTADATTTEGSVSQWEGSKRRWATF